MAKSVTAMTGGGAECPAQPTEQEKARDMFSMAIYTMISIIIQLPFIIGFYVSFIKKEKMNFLFTI